VRLRTEGVTWQEIDGELVILDLESSAYLTTNVSGAVLAKQLRQERTLDDLAQTLTDEFGLDSEVATRDSSAFVQQLREKRLLVED